MPSPTTLAERFRSLHNAKAPLLLANAWDPLSAALVADAGLPAVATASAAVALSRGLEDGEQIDFDDLVRLVERISDTVSVPVSVDFERGYGDSPDGVRENTKRLIEAGAAGVNIEDSVGQRILRPVGEQCERIRAVRAAGEDLGAPIFINARIDAFMVGLRADEALSRAEAYVNAGADGIYPIMCNDLSTLERIHSAAGRPINALLVPSLPPLQSLVDAGVRRISMGPGLLSISAGAIGEALRRLAEGDLFLTDLPRLATSAMRDVQGLT